MEAEEEERKQEITPQLAQEILAGICQFHSMLHKRQFLIQMQSNACKIKRHWQKNDSRENKMQVETHYVPQKRLQREGPRTPREIPREAKRVGRRGERDECMMTELEYSEKYEVIQRRERYSINDGEFPSRGDHGPPSQKQH